MLGNKRLSLKIQNILASFQIFGRARNEHTDTVVSKRSLHNSKTRQHLPPSTAILALIYATLPPQPQ